MLTPAPHSEKQGDFYAWHSWTETNLENLLQISFKKEEIKSSKLSLVKLHLKAKSDYENGKESGAFYLAILYGLVNDLDFLKTNNFPHFESFRRIFTSGKNNQNSYLIGHGFEVKIARLLVEKGFAYGNPEPPDFSVNFRDTVLSIECYAPTAPKNKRYFSKVYSNKVKPYRGKDWTKHFPILFVDVTDWRFVENDSFPLLANNNNSEPIVKDLSNLAKNNIYKLVVFFHFGRSVNPQLNGTTISLQYSPSENLNPILKSFINKLSSGFTDEKFDLFLSPIPPD